MLTWLKTLKLDSVHSTQDSSLTVAQLAQQVEHIITDIIGLSSNFKKFFIVNQLKWVEVEVTAWVEDGKVNHCGIALEIMQQILIIEG